MTVLTICNYRKDSLPYSNEIRISFTTVERYLSIVYLFQMPDKLFLIWEECPGLVRKQTWCSWKRMSEQQCWQVANRKCCDDNGWSHSKWSLFLQCFPICKLNKRNPSHDLALHGPQWAQQKLPFSKLIIFAQGNGSPWQPSWLYNKSMLKAWNLQGESTDVRTWCRADFQMRKAMTDDFSICFWQSPGQQFHVWNHELKMIYEDER